MPKPAEEKHLRTQLEELRKKYDTLSKRIAALDTDIGRALDSVTKQVREEERAELEAERSRVAAKMAQIERQLSDAGKAAIIAVIGLVLVALICVVAKCVPFPTSVVLQTDHGRYITALKDDPEGDRAWMLWAETKRISYWEKFALQCVADGKAALRTHHGRYVTATGEDKGWALMAETKEIGESEKFTLFNANTQQTVSCSDVLQAVEQGPVTLALQTADGWYVTAVYGEQTGRWMIQGNAATINKWEKFTVIER